MLYSSYTQVARIVLWFLFYILFLESVFAGAIVASYNVRNYLTMDRLVDGGWRKEYPKPESEKRVVRESIIAVNPDILILQEMGSLAHLEELRRDLANEGLRYEGRYLFEAADEERRLAALWKEEIAVTPIGHDDLTIKYFGRTEFVKRGLLELRIGKGERQWRIFGAHLKSRYTDDGRDPQSIKRRSKEAEAIRDRILSVVEKSSEARYLILGDLNDTPNNRPLRALFKKGKREISIDVPAYDSRGEIWTHFYKKGATYSRVDYILRSPGFIDLEDVSGTIHSPANYYDGSDHRLVWVEMPSW